MWDNIDTLYIVAESNDYELGEVLARLLNSFCNVNDTALTEII